MKRPAFQFYPADWRKDVELQSCSMAAQGLWINLMCVAHECEPYGHLALNGKPMNEAQIGRQVGLSARDAQRLLDELLGAGVARRAPDGAIFSKRMVADEHIRNVRADAGRLGGNPNLLGDKVKQKSNQKPTPSSSSSSSSSPSGSRAVPDGTDAAGVAQPLAEPRPKLTDPAEIIFGYGVPMLTAAGSTDKHARTFLGGLRKMHGDAALVDKLRACAKAKPLQPLEWLAAALPPPGAAFAGERAEEASRAESARTTAEAKRMLFGDKTEEAIDA